MELLTYLVIFLFFLTYGLLANETILRYHYTKLMLIHNRRFKKSTLRKRDRVSFLLFKTLQSVNAKRKKYLRRGNWWSFNKRYVNYNEILLEESAIFQTNNARESVNVQTTHNVDLYTRMNSSRSSAVNVNNRLTSDFLNNYSCHETLSRLKINKFFVSDEGRDEHVAFTFLGEKHVFKIKLIETVDNFCRLFGMKNAPELLITMKRFQNTSKKELVFQPNVKNTDNRIDCVFFFVDSGTVKIFKKTETISQLTKNQSAFSIIHCFNSLAFKHKTFGCNLFDYKNLTTVIEPGSSIYYLEANAFYNLVMQNEINPLFHIAQITLFCAHQVTMYTVENFFLLPNKLFIKNENNEENVKNTKTIHDLFIESVEKIFALTQCIDTDPELKDNLLKKSQILLFDKGKVILSPKKKLQSMFFIVEGHVQMFSNNESNNKSPLYSLPESNFICIPNFFIGGNSLYTYIAGSQPTKLLSIDMMVFHDLVLKSPTFALYLANTFVSTVSNFIKNIDFVLDWIHLETGNRIDSQCNIFNRNSSHLKDSSTDSNNIENSLNKNQQAFLTSKMYYILNGKISYFDPDHANSSSLNNTLTQNGNTTHQNNPKSNIRLHKNDVAGLPETLNDMQVDTIVALRDSELISVPNRLFYHIKKCYKGHFEPHLINLLSKKIFFHNNPSYQHHQSTNEREKEKLLSPPPFPAITIVPIVNDHSNENLCFDLAMSINKIFSCCYINKKSFRSVFQLGLPHMPAHISSWLAQIESQHKVVVYLADSQMTNWTKQCLRQSYLVVYVVFNDMLPQLSMLARDIDEGNTEYRNRRQPARVIFVHHLDNRQMSFKHTKHWLSLFKNVSDSYHVRLPEIYFNRRYLLSKSFERSVHKQFVWEKGGGQRSMITDAGAVILSPDIARLSRILTGNAVGLVLGGGGAKGFAHLGVIDVLEKANVPIDLIGGVSIGSFMGGLYAKHGASLKEILPIAIKMADDVNKTFYNALDLALPPIVSVLTGRRFNSVIKQAIGDSTQIEELLIPYYCLSVDLNNVDRKIHNRGSLWRYVRASMTLPAFVPPMCDPIDGHLLVDGGFIDNVPAKYMKSRGAGVVFAVDVGAVEDTDYTNYGDDLSGLKVLFGRLTRTMRIPSLGETQARLAGVSSYSELEMVKNMQDVVYMRPPIDGYGTLQFGAAAEIIKVGVDHANKVLHLDKKKRKTTNSIMNESHMKYEHLFRRLDEILKRTHRFDDEEKQTDYTKENKKLLRNYSKLFLNFEGEAEKYLPMKSFKRTSAGSQMNLPTEKSENKFFIDDGDEDETRPAVRRPDSKKIMLERGYMSDDEVLYKKRYRRFVNNEEPTSKDDDYFETHSA